MMQEQVRLLSGLVPFSTIVVGSGLSTALAVFLQLMFKVI